MKQESTRPANADQASVQLSNLLKSTCGSGAYLLLNALQVEKCDDVSKYRILTSSCLCLHTSTSSHVSGAFCSIDAGITGITGITRYSLLLYSCDRPYSNALAQAVTKPRLAAVALPPKT